MVIRLLVKSFYYSALTLVIQLMDKSLKCRNIKMKITVCRCECVIDKLGFIAEYIIIAVHILSTVLYVCLVSYMSEFSKYLK